MTYQSVWKLVAVLFLIALGLSEVFAQMQSAELEAHRHPPGSYERHEQLGQVNFRVSCSAEAQQQFNRATALLHSFEYERAEQAFSQVGETDPNCAMAYWGIAMSNYHPLWAPPTPEELKKGTSAIETGRSKGRLTKRESDYLAAIATFYTDADTLDHRRLITFRGGRRDVFDQDTRGFWSYWRWAGERHRSNS